MELSAKELRLGNLVAYNGKTPTQIEPRHFCNMSEGLLIDMYKPIILNEEWLEKFGFDKGSECYTLNGVKIKDNGYIGVYDIYRNNIELNTQVKHVHQLQNLYFVLTGKELILNN